MGIEWGLAIDCARPKVLAEFWVLALGYEPEPPPPGFATWEDGCVDQDIPEDEWDERASMSDPAGVGPRIFFQQVPEGKVAKNRLHLDIRR